MQLRLENPQAFWALVPLFLVGLRLLWKRFRQPHLFSHRITLLALTAFFLGILALSRPQGGRQVAGQKGNQSNLFFAFDISRSMLAEDVLPSRLGLAVRYVDRLLRELGTVRVAIYSFAQEGYLFLPLTTDVYAVSDSLQSLHPNNSTAQGTNLSLALKGLLEQIKHAEQVTKSHGAEWAAPQVVLISDGEGHDKLEESVMAEYRKLRIPVFTVMVGTSSGTSIPLEGRYPSSSEILRDDSGKAVITKANPMVLDQIARATGGAYYEGKMSTVPVLYSRLKQAMQMGKLTTTFRLEREFFPALIIIALALFLIHFLMMRWEYAIRSLLLVLCLGSVVSYANTEKKAAENYNHASQLMKEGKFEKATEKFQEAALGSQDKKLQKKSLFNMGNAFLKLGDPTQALMGYQSAHDIQTEDKHFDKEANQKISENIVLAAKIEQQQKQKKKKGKQGEGDDSQGEAGDPGGAQKFESEPMSEGAKERIFDQNAAEERQALERLREKNKRSSQLSGKTW